MQSTVLESTAEANIFWTSLIATNLIWLFFLFVCVFTFNFKWLVRHARPNILFEKQREREDHSQLSTLTHFLFDR